MKKWCSSAQKFISYHYRALKNGEFWIGVIYGCVLMILVNYKTNPAVDLISECNRSNAPNDNQVLTDVKDVQTMGQAASKNRILCWVVTTPQNTFKAERVKKTWGKRCDKLLFISSQNDTFLPAVGLPIGQESRAKLWEKAKLTFRYVYDHYLDEFEWFYKADDDTYVIMENLVHLLSNWNSSLPLFLGRQFHDPGRKITFLAGGSGYVLTRETLRRLVEQGLDRNVCRTDLPGDLDDLIISVCLKRLGAIFGDTRDQYGLQRFIPFNPEELYNNSGRNMRTSLKFDIFPVGKGYKCCSNQAVAFHYVPGYKMQFLEYLIYKLNVTKNGTGTT